VYSLIEVWRKFFRATLILSVVAVVVGCSSGGDEPSGSGAVASTGGSSSSTASGVSSSASSSSASTSSTSSSTSSTSSMSSSSNSSSMSSSASSSSSSALPTNPMGEARASLLLTHGTFGPTLVSVAEASAQNLDQWFTSQASISPSLLLPSVPNKDADVYRVWLTNSVKGNDQLRQRIAFSLSEIMVISFNGGPLQYESQAIASYYDILVQNALGNFRTLLEQVTLSPSMGVYLSMFRNDKPNPATGVHADENYAREIMQLFSIGLVQLNLDGTVKRDSSGNTIPTYSQKEVENLARVFTGWASNPLQGNLDSAWQFDYDYLRPMVNYSNHHDIGSKTILNSQNVPANGTAAADLKIALDTIFNHPNVGPFIGKQLIQRLVTSNPSPAYVARVASAFNNSGSGVRGDLLSVVKAVLTDSEAVSVSNVGKLREPLLRLTHIWRAFNASSNAGHLGDEQFLLYGYSEFAQGALQSPSVFNFFRPDYRRAGAITDAGLVAPEFQIANEKTVVLTENRLQLQTYQYKDSAGVVRAGPDYDLSGFLGNSSVLLNTTSWEPFAATASELVNKLNLILMAGRMPDPMKATLTSYVGQIPAASRASRVIEAVDLIVNSPQYAVQH
jgi:uncharacterized protein (DUF1800 family)